MDVVYKTMIGPVYQIIYLCILLNILRYILDSNCWNNTMYRAKCYENTEMWLIPGVI